MTPQIALLFLILGLALIAFWFEWVSADVVALGVLLALVLAGLVPLQQAFAGFGSDTVIMILGLLILTAALVRTGVVDLIGRGVLRHTGENPNRVLGIVMGASAATSTFFSNTASTALFLPVVLGLAQRLRLSATKLLMPLAFATILASSITLISTSTNVVVSGLMTQYGLSPMGMLELAPVGLPIALAGLLYMYTIGRRLLPEREAPGPAGFDLGGRVYLAEILLPPDSPLVGKTLAEAALGRDLDLNVLRIRRAATRQFVQALADTLLEAEDELLVRGPRDAILKVKDTAGIDFKADVKLSEAGLQADDLRMVEGILLPRSPLLGRTLRGARFRERFGLQVLAIFRHGEALSRQISRTILRLGDVLLIQGQPDKIQALEAGGHIAILNAVDERRPNLQRAWMAISAFLGALALATFEIVPTPVALMLGVLAVFATRCITPEEAYREVEWKAIILIGCMLAVGAAMQHSGAAEYLAGGLAEFAGAARPGWLLTGFFALTVLLTQPMSNQAAAVVVAPIAIQTALQLGLNPRTFAMMIAVAASCSYLTPLEPACLMVYGPGRYRFADFLKVGALLTVLVYGIAIVLVPRVWPP